MPAARYRPRQPRASPIWQILDGRWADFRRNEAVHDDHLNQTVQAFLRCGDFRSGFTRWRCPDCAQEFLLAFTCKQRGLCATCAQRRTLTLAPYIAETVCHAVPHRHIVLTIPRVLRPVFRRNRALLTELFHAAHEVLGLWLRERTGGADGQPGIVIAAQTFGDFLSWHPHLHLLVTAGVFRADNTFALASPGGWRQLAELWRHAVLRRLLKHQAINDNQAEKLLSWNHSGFNLDAGEAPLAARDVAGRRRLAEYLIRSPFNLEKISYEPRTGNVLYRSEKHWRTRRNFEVFSAAQFIEALVNHLPPKNVPMLRYYGAYSNKCRGMRRKASTHGADSSSHETSPKPTASRRPRWRQLIIKVWGCDPLQCPLCQGRLRLLEIIEEETDIRATLMPIGMWSPQKERRHHPPGSDSLVDPATGQSHSVGRETSPVVVHPWRSKSEPLAWRQFVFGEYTTDQGDDFDQCGCEVPPCYEEAPEDIDQLTIFDDGYQPDPPAGEPVFWPSAGIQEFPEDDFIRYSPDERT